MGTLSGAWEDKAQPWHEIHVLNCQVCGRLIPQRTWRFIDPDFGTILACTPPCETLWYHYVRARQAEMKASPHDGDGASDA